MAKAGRKRSIDYGRVEQLAASGLTNAQIAARMGCAVVTVRRILKRKEKS